MNMELQGWIDLAQLMADGHAIRIVWEEGCKQPRTDGRRIYVGAPEASWTPEQTKEWAGTLFHEIGHNVPQMRDCFELPKKYGFSMDSFYGLLINIVDDYRQEKHQHGWYEGRDRALSFMQGAAIQQNLDNWSEQMTPEDELGEMGLACFLLVRGMRSHWQPDVSAIFHRFLHKVTEYPKVIELYRKVVDDGEWAASLDAMRTAEDVKACVDRLLDIWGYEMSEQDKQSPEGEEQEEAAASSWGKYKDMLHHDHGEAEVTYKPTHIEYEDDDYHCDSMTYTPPKVEKDFSAENAHYKLAIQEVPSSGEIGAQVRRLLMTKTASRWQHGHRKGRLNGKALARVPSGYEEVFKRKESSLTLDTAVSILVDHSGSMGGEKYANAAKAARILAEAISVCRVPLEILGFYERQKTHMIEYKSFGDSVSPDELERRFACTGPRGCNDDGAAILFTNHRLQQQPNSRKLLLVLSDGSPACGRADAAGFAKKAIEEVEKLHDTSIIGLGIVDRNVERLYTKHSTIDDASQLEQAVLEIVKQEITA